MKHFWLTTVPEGTSLPEPVFPVETTPTGLVAGEIDIETLAERLTGRKSPELHLLDEAFPPHLTPLDDVPEPEWRELLAQLESFISPRLLPR